MDKGPKKREAVRDQAKKGFVMGDYTPKVFDKSPEMASVLRNIVTTNILFSSYGAEEHKGIVDAFQPEAVKAESFVIKQGEQGEKFYVVESGSLDIFVKNSSGENQKVGNTLGPGSSFGELALMYNTPRAASVVSTSPVTLWAMERLTFRTIVMQRIVQKRNRSESLLADSSLTSAFDANERDADEKRIRFFLASSSNAVRSSSGSSSPSWVVTA